MPSFELGESIPPDTAHAVSVSLPTWKSNVGYEEGEDWVVSRMTTGYPRFYVHKTITGLAEDIVAQHGQSGFSGMLFPTVRSARRCQQFIQARVDPQIVSRITVLDFGLDLTKKPAAILCELSPTISAVLYPTDAQSAAKQYWQHTGDGVSSRRAEFCHGLFREGLLVPKTAAPDGNGAGTARPFRGPRRYTRPGSFDGVPAKANSTTQSIEPDAGKNVTEAQESSRFLEERFGRNLDMSLVERAKSAIRRRIVGAVAGDVDTAGNDVHEMVHNTRGLKNLREDDIYLFPCGMNAIFNAHQALLAARTPAKSISFGFPYVDTLKILQKFGPGCVFYGHGSDDDMDEIEKSLRAGERFLALFCEFPGNPLLKCPDLVRIRRLADEFDFALVIDETIGTFANVNVLPVADIVVSSLTKIFSGDSNVMGGCAILNPEGRYYGDLKQAMAANFEDTYWPEDVLFMERNSRDFSMRIDRINTNAEAICETLRADPTVKDVFYPKYNPSKCHYDSFRVPKGGYGGLLSIVFHQKTQAQAFYDAMDIAKGPSLGTNFTLCSPYVLLAHYQELPWAEKFGVDPYLVRVSVGLEDTAALQQTFNAALQAARGSS
ncbi:pyridoxal phosphate-dependent transferase [Emericellopsis atlantica]|uniref:cystathionine gamma-synthase n=1 Tax=Emericellopsis atlantica TaxID=2614577 RepID=A0A9P7ZDQ9_9HYPO|nr:pyridoxal phosphate-dependent transferase [Emericellopsis atlantica]KAG9250135.1 pyridoxal phosphate-dependent transferase [Emericellopsis atlantica]